MVKLCWNAIVKNEAGRILRACASVAPYISSWVIADTGSTDGTPELIEQFFAKAAIPGQIIRCEFHDFGQARNVALHGAQTSNLPFDYILLMDADMELKVLQPDKWLDICSSGAPSYDMMQIAGTLHYANRRLAKRGEPHGYLGVTHEYLNLAAGGCIPMTAAVFVDYADGSNRPDKFKRDIRLLKGGLEKEPNNIRYMYYLAQSYRDAGKFEKAIKWYKRVVEKDEWDQEKWSAQYCMGSCFMSLGDESEFIRTMLFAYNMRPTRAEPLHDLARYYRNKGDNPLAAMFAETALQMPKSEDQLFVDDYCYNVGCLQEFAISAFYVPYKRLAGYKATNKLMLQPTPYRDAQELARTNIFHYLEPLSKFCPSYKSQILAFTPPEHYVAMNPSIAMDRGKLYGVIRTVNYRIDDQGRYLIRATDGTCNATNPIHTRNFLAALDFDFKILGETEIVGEPYTDAGLPGVKFDLVRGYEDMRLYAVNGELWASATVRELEADGPCEQVRVQLKPAGKSLYGTKTANLVRMLRRGHEKNWMPMADGKEHRFFYRADEVVDGEGRTMIKTPQPIAIDTLAGGSQAIKVKEGWLAVVHEARQIPGAPCRFYSHRFIAWDKDFYIRKVSPPFFFEEKGIEYAAGLVLDETDGRDRLIISFGFKDREPRIATVSIKDVTNFLWQS